MGKKHYKRLCKKCKCHCLYEQSLESCESVKRLIPCVENHGHIRIRHTVDLQAPDGVTFEVEKGTQVTITGADKQAVGQFAAQIREVRKPEPYKGKGIKYVTETIRRKAGKVVKAAGA